MHFIKKITFSVLLTLSSIYLPAQNIDINLLKSINEGGSRFKNCYFKTTAQSVSVFNIAAPMLVAADGMVHHNKKLEKDAVYMVGAFVLSTALTDELKKTVHRQRPFVTYSKIIVKRDVGGGYSFPSGHTSAAFCTATALSQIYPKWYVIIPSYLYASSVGYSRMYLGVHYPTDVLAGALVGAGSAYLSRKIEKWMNREHTY